MSYVPNVLLDMISWRIKYVENMKTVIDNVMRMLDHGIANRVVCYILAGIHYQLDMMKNDIAKMGTELAWYVGSRTVARLNQVDVSYLALQKLYQNKLIPYQVYQRGTSILLHESDAIYSRWQTFVQHLQQAYQNLTQKVEEVITYLESKMDSVCTS